MGLEHELMGTRYCSCDNPPRDGAGLYAIFLKKASLLPGIEVGQSGLLYIGKSEWSLEARNHFDYQNSASSTLRRSLGAILKQELKLSAFPRGFRKNAGPRDIQNYRFDEKGEIALSKWMNDNLEFSYLLLKKDHIKTSERQHIQKHDPPLNISLSKNPMRMKLAELRKLCREEASRWTNTKR
jgi:hypothetical protein